VTAAAITIAPAAPADDEVVRALFGALHMYNTALDPRFALADGWEAVLDQHLLHVREAGHGLTLLAWCGQEPVGLAMFDGHLDSPLFRHRRWCELLALYVAGEARGAGVADRLLEDGIAWARARGYERMQLYVTATNLPAKRFYARSGFRPVQEIWRRELDAAGPPIEDCPIDAAVFAQGHELLTPHHHHYAIDPDPHEDDR
jgi:GNAT superfamily N-acetyltransferase